MLLSPSCADPLYRRSVRVSMGEVFAIPYARFASWPDGLHELLAAGFALLALTPDAGATRLDSLTFSDDAKLALLLGSEGPGLSAAALSAAQRVRIAMSAGVDSLNVAAATAVACYALRRRSAVGGQRLAAGARPRLAVSRRHLQGPRRHSRLRA